MKHTFKKTLSIILAAMMLICSVPLAGLTDIDLPDLGTLFAPKAEAATSGTCGANLTWTFDESTGTLTISGTGDMYNWTSPLSTPWVNERGRIKSVLFTHGVTSIGNHAFEGFSSLENVMFPSSIKRIGDAAFFGARFTEVTIGDGVTHIGKSAFRDCDSLESVIIGENVAIIDHTAFFTCDKLTNITIPDSVTSIGEFAFSACRSLTDLSLGNGVTSIGSQAFQESSITHVTIPASVMSIGNYAFDDCGKLTEIIVDDDNATYSSDEYGVLFNKDKTVLIQYPIGNIRTNYVIPNGVRSIGISSFARCYNLTNLTIPYGVKDIGLVAFCYCTFTSVTIPHTVEIIRNSAFYECYDLADVYYTGSKEDWKSTTIEGYNYCLTGSTIHYNYVLPCFHSYTSEITTPATCTENGVKTYTCSECGDVYTEAIPATGHNAGEWEVVTNSSCTAVGEKVKKCTVCGEVLETEEIAMAEHIAGEWETTENATCTENGEQVKKCLNCAEILETETIPATGHTQGEWAVSIAPSCTEEGEKIANCTECGIVVANDVVSATGHTAGEIEVTTPATCTENGEGTGSCVVCGEVIETIEIPATGHSAGVWETILEPTTETEGKKVKKCTVCGFTLEEATIAKLPKEPVRDNAVVNTPSTSTINFGDAIILRVDESRIPEGGRVEWSASNGNFEWEANGTTCEISPEKSGDTTFTATIYDADGNPVSVDEQTMTSKAGFFQKIIAFFKGLFGLNKTIPNVFKF